VKQESVQARAKITRHGLKFCLRSCAIDMVY
jgi:hypothetical protein